MKRLAGKIAIVTGAAQGIGACYAIGLAEQGAKVVVTDVADTSAVVEHIIAEGGQALGCHADVTNSDSLAAMVQLTEQTFGTIDILVNNAALFANLVLKPFSQIDEDEWDLVMRVNARGPFQCTKAVLASMKKNGKGKIINISSGTFLRGAPMFCHYVASKGAVIGQTRALATELGPDNIQINCLIVGLTESEGVKKHTQLDQAKSNTLASRIIKREMLPEDLLGSIYFLASSDSDFMTGQCINIDGGALNH
jgi:NAD(P)-dependent dehydrogenase (short-subunit alcohol dehydrogenase family)